MDPPPLALIAPKRGVGRCSDASHGELYSDAAPAQSGTNKESLMSLCSFAGIADSSTCASWVQAWGSIAAILAAVVVAYVQHRQNLKAQREQTRSQDAQAISAHLALAERVTHELRRLREPIITGMPPTQFEAGLSLDKLAGDLAAFQGLPIHSLPTYEAIAAVRGLTQHMAEAAEHLKNVAYLRSLGWADEEALPKAVAQFDQAMDFAETECTLLVANFDRHGGAH